LLDFGGGIGLISLISKSIGIKKVTYLDISREMTQGARNLANTFNIKIDNYVTGTHTLLPDSEYNIIISYDVIEHIYNIEETLNSLYAKLSPGGVMLMASGANPLNPRLRKILISIHKNTEFKDRPKKKERDCNKAYYHERLRVGRKKAKELGLKLTEEDLRKIASQSRGKIKQEIEKLIVNIKDNGIKNITGIPEIKEFEKASYLNTCDPYTGNWNERLMHPYLLVKKMSDYKSSTFIEAGLYHRSNSMFKRYLGSVLNFMIKLLPRFNLYFAPYYIIKIFK